MPLGSEEEDCFDVVKVARCTAVVMGPVTSGGSYSGKTVATSSSLIGEGGGGLLRTLV